MCESTCPLPCRKMNLGEDRRESQTVLSPRILPVLVLLKVWSECGEDPCENVDLVLLLLETVCSLEGSQDKDVSLQSLVESLRAMEDVFLATKFIDYVEETGRSLTSFMDLFEKLLVSLLSHSLDDDDDDESKSPLITTFPLTPVLGVFVSQCVSAYRCLTFHQVVRLHRQWGTLTTTHTDTSNTSTSRKVASDKVKVLMEKQDFLSALDELTLPSSLDLPLGDEGKEEGTRRDPSSEALRLAALHDFFGHKEEGTRAIHEAIRLALQENNIKLLQHCLAWLHKLQPFSGEDALSVLKRLTAKAQELHQPLLAGWGRLEESKALLDLGKDPQQVLQVALSSGCGECVPVYSPRVEKVAHRAAALAALAKIWDHYGFSHVSQLYCQLQGHVMSCDPPPTELEGRENCVISVSMTARHLLQMGEYGAVKALFRSAKKLLESNGKSYKLLCQCVEEVGFDWSVQTGDLGAARRHLARLQSLHSHSSLLRSAILSGAVGNYTEARKLALQLLKLNCSPHIKCRALEVLGEVECVSGRPALSLPHLMESLTLCHTHHLSPYSTQLWLAQAQLQLESPYACASLATKCLLHFQACCDVVHRGKSQFLLAQASLLTRHQHRGHLDKQDVLVVIPVLEEVVADFQKASATGPLQKAALLLAEVYDTAGYDDKRDKMVDIAQHNGTPSYIFSA